MNNYIKDHLTMEYIHILKNYDPIINRCLQEQKLHNLTNEQTLIMITLTMSQTIKDLKDLSSKILQSTDKLNKFDTTMGEWLNKK